MHRGEYREMADKCIVLITGGNQGIGYECARNLLCSDERYHVILGCRSSANGERAVKQLQAAALRKDETRVECIELDVTKDHTIKAAADLVFRKYRRIDCIVNNAGICEKWTGDSVTNKLRKVLNTNTVGPVLVTDTFLDLLRNSKSPRLIFVSSSSGSLTHAADPSSPYYGSKTGRRFPWYRVSKAALNMTMIEYHKQLASEGVKVHGVDPGLVVTNFLNAEAVGRTGAPGAEVGGATVADVVKGEKDDDTGRVVGRYGVSPW